MKKEDVQKHYRKKNFFINLSSCYFVTLMIKIKTHFMTKSINLFQTFDTRMLVINTIKYNVILQKPLLTSDKRYARWVVSKFIKRRAIVATIYTQSFYEFFLVGSNFQPHNSVLSVSKETNISYFQLKWFTSVHST